MKISRVLHAGYIFENKDTRILFDPIFENPFSQNCFAFPNVKFDVDKLKYLKFSAIFISHIHDDHCSLESLNLLDKNTPLYIYTTSPEIVFLLNQLGFKKVIQLEIDQVNTVGSFEIVARKALNSEVDSIFEINCENFKVLNIVDSWLDPQTLEQLAKKSPWDLVLWPFQILREVEVLSPNNYSLDVPIFPREWIEQIKKLNPRNIVPSSCQFKHEEWSWLNNKLFSFSYEEFFKNMKYHLPNISTFKLNPGESIQLDIGNIRMEKPLEWIEILVNEKTDYKFDLNSNIPSTSEVAKKFPELDTHLKKEIQNFITKKMCRLFSVIGPSQDRFFNKNRMWRLSIFNSDGEESSFDFNISENKLTWVAHNSLFDWKTEISEFKLHRALWEGESLTSLYLRVINPANVDPLEDPLIRILYSRDPLTYQKAQLKKITTARDLL